MKNSGENDREEMEARKTGKMRLGGKERNGEVL